MTALRAQEDGANEAPLAIDTQRVYAAQEKFDRPLFVAFHDAAAEMAYVVEQPGTVWMLKRDDESKDRTPFLDLSKRVYANDKQRQAVLVARLDNLGKGASGAAVQNIALMLGLAHHAATGRELAHA